MKELNLDSKINILQLLCCFLFVSSTHSAYAAKHKQSCREDLIYITDNVKELAPTLQSRASLYGSGLRDQWADLPAKFTTTSEGEKILTIHGLEVMREFERPYMKSIARTVVSRGGRVLNVGFGLGIIDSYMERSRRHLNMGEHHIIELNKQVFQKAQQWKETLADRNKIILHQGDWNEVLVELKRQNITFRGIAYDAFPLEAQDLHRDFIPFLKKVIELKLVEEENGIITFYMDSADGFGKSFGTFIKELGVNIAYVERVDVQLPKGGNQYWRHSHFLTPTLTGIKYK